MVLGATFLQSPGPTCRKQMVLWHTICWRSGSACWAPNATFHSIKVRERRRGREGERYLFNLSIIMLPVLSCCFQCTSLYSQQLLSLKRSDEGRPPCLGQEKPGSAELKVRERWFITQPGSFCFSYISCGECQAGLHSIAFNDRTLGCPQTEGRVWLGRGLLIFDKKNCSLRAWNLWKWPGGKSKKNNKRMFFARISESLSHTNDFKCENFQRPDFKTFL